LYSAIGEAVPVALALEMNPDGKTEEHGFLVVAAGIVPLPYGAPVETATGITVAVLMMTSAEDSAAPFPLPTVTAATLPARAVGVAVTVTVERATVSVTVTGAQDAAPEAGDPPSPLALAPEFPPTPAEADEAAAGMTVTYLVEVEVPWMVVVRASEDAAAAPVTEAGLVA
jgi:hypothetical protein